MCSPAALGDPIDQAASRLCVVGPSRKCELQKNEAAQAAPPLRHRKANAQQRLRFVAGFLPVSASAQNVATCLAPSVIAAEA
ncbi:hypothetical protein D9M68_340110 [compost metagenome]